MATNPIPLKEQLFLFGNCNIIPDRYDDVRTLHPNSIDPI